MEVRAFSCPGSQVPRVLPPVEGSGREHRRSTSKLLPGHNTKSVRADLEPRQLWVSSVGLHGADGNQATSRRLEQSVARLTHPVRSPGQRQVPKAPQRAVSGETGPQCCGLSGSPGAHVCSAWRAGLSR